MSTATVPQAALSVTTDRAVLPTVEIIKMPRPYMRGACLVRCSDARLSGCFISGPAARAYVASLVASGTAVAA